MELSSYLQILTSTATIFFIIILISNHILKKNQIFIIPINWPFVGMLPHLLLNVHRFHDWCITLLQLHNGTFLFKGPWFTSMELLVTTDPSNVHYVMSKNFPNFPKGEEYSRIFDILGDGIFNSDFELWRYQRKVAHSFFTHPSFHRFLTKTVTSKAEKGLIPILDCGYKSAGRVLDLEDLLQRFTFDTICTLVTGSDPSCLSVDLPDAPFCKALDKVEEVLFLRHIVPETVWKLQRWFGIGSEKRLSRAWEVLDGFIYNALAIKRQELKSRSNHNRLNGHEFEQDQGLDLLTLYMQECGDNQDAKFSDKFLRDMFLNMLIAGRDTTSAALTWFFWLLNKNPHVETKIRQELKSITTKQSFSQVEEVCKLVYLHGALCETLRLYPPVPLEHKSPLEPDVLPSGHRARTSTKIIFNLYAMGRSESIWGDDCLEFKPERWITEKGKVKHEPSYKFLAFNAGPRTCIGKEMAFVQMKAVAASVLANGYRLQVVDERKVEPDISIILHTKHGLKAKVLKTPF